MRKLTRIVPAISQSSLLWGCLGSIGFFTLIHHDILPHSDLLRRYTSREWAEIIEATFFFVGTAELLLKAFDIAEQRSRLRKGTLLEGMPAGPLPAADVTKLLDHLRAMPARDRHGFWPRRLREALEAIWRQGSADSLDDELKHLASLDATRSHDGFAFSRIVIWAIPIWGFLGTVLGITDAIASLNPSSMENTLTQVTASLGGVFDTTALALGLSITLMFFQYYTDRMEARLLTTIDELATEVLTGRFERSTTSRDPQTAAIERMGQAVVQSVERLVERQAQVWQKTIDAAHQRWNELTSAGGEQMQKALAESLAASVEAHAEQLGQIEAQHARKNRRYWTRLQKTLALSAQATQAQQAELAKQGQLLLRVVEATAHVAQLEEALNRNLGSLASSQHLQETLLSVAGAVQLLHARLAHVGPLGQHVDLKDSKLGKAA